MDEKTGEKTILKPAKVELWPGNRQKRGAGERAALRQDDERGAKVRAALRTDDERGATVRATLRKDDGGKQDEIPGWA